MKTHYLIRDLVGLAGLPATARGLQKAIKRENWTTREVTGLGGMAIEVAYDSLPKATQAALQARVIEQVNQKYATVNASSALVATQTGGGLAACAATMVVVDAAQPVSVASKALVTVPAAIHMPNTTPATGLSDVQRSIASARAVLVRYVLTIASSLGGAGYTNSIRQVANLSKMGQLPPEVREAAMLAHGKPRKTRVMGEVSFGTLQKWVLGAAKSVGEQNGSSIKHLLRMQSSHIAVPLPTAALAPGKLGRKQAPLPVWTSDLLAVWRDPNKPELMTCVRTLIDRGVLPLSEKVSAYHAARRILSRMGALHRESGRMSAKAMKALKPFIRRDTGSMNPGDVYTADGHTLDAEVNHPLNGTPFRPEVTAVLDVATRRWMGWSLALKENQLTVIEALLGSCQHAIPSIFYVDNGVGYKGSLVADPKVGLAERLGITLTHSLPYNAQGKGLMERFWQNITKLAQRLPSYMGMAADRDNVKRIFTASRKDMAERGFSPLLPSFRQLADMINYEMANYNDRPHRALPKLFDLQLQKQRHMTPNEAWELGTRRMGQKLPCLTPLERNEFYRPQVERKMQRCEINLHGARYFCKDAEQWNAKTVNVSFDVADPSQIWIYDQDGYYLCAGQLDGNKRDYFPVSFTQQAAIKRVKAKVKRAMVGVTNAETELNRTVDVQVSTVAYQPAEQVVPVLMDTQERPRFTDMSQRYEWVMHHQSQATVEDWHKLDEWAHSNDYQTLRECFESENIAWKGIPEGVAAYPQPQLLKAA